MCEAHQVKIRFLRRFIEKDPFEVKNSFFILRGSVAHIRNKFNSANYLMLNKIINELQTVLIR